MSDVPPPPVPSASPPPPVPPPPPAIGKRRSIGLVILLSIVTFGIWTVVWSYQNGDELKRYSSRGIGGVGYLFITLLIAPATMFLMASEVEQIYRNEGREPRITTLWGLWFLLPLIGNIIWYVRIQRAINELWRIHGAAGSAGL
ncbi:MAG: DUF4234 domain-containing protein [Actinomycetota bacterium]